MEKPMLTHLSLFSGIGGIDLAAEWAGFTTIGQCEFADYPTKVLEKHWPDMPRWKDIRTLTRERFYEKTGHTTVDLISGGFPCQPFSVAGKQKGKGDNRYLWPEMLRVIREIKPRWVLGENVPGILQIAAADIVSDLEREGFECVVFDFEAAAVEAKHRRERIFFVGNATSKRQQRSSVQQRAGASATPVQAEQQSGNNHGRHCGQAESGLGRMADGIPCWVDGYWDREPNVSRIVTEKQHNRAARIKTLGNAVVPQQVYPILRAIALVEKERS